MPRAKSKPPVLDAPQASHGERAELLRAQRQAAPPPGAPPAGAPQPGGTGAPPQPRPPSGPQDIIRMAQTQMPGRGPGLGDPTMRPDEPITSGIAAGPGRGPVRAKTRAAQVLGRLAAMSDDRQLTQLAMKAEIKGL